MNVELVSQTKPYKPYFKKKLQELVNNEVITQEEADKNYENLNAEQLIIYIARVSSPRDNKLEDYGKLLNYLIDHKHWSPFEHAYMTVEIETSRAIGRQLLRHRSFTFQEFSQRYMEALDSEPIELREQGEHNRQAAEGVINPILENGKRAQVEVEEILSTINNSYQRLLDAGVGRECARFILPESTSTTIYMTGNIRSWIHFIDLRKEANSQKEMRKVAQEIGKIFQEQYLIISKSLGFNYE